MKILITEEQEKKVFSCDNFDFVRLSWVDAIENNEGWMSLRDAKNWGRTDQWLIHQTGWIIKQTKEYILLVSRISEPSSGRGSDVSGVFKIPTTWIKYKKVLRKKNENINKSKTS